jgi:hypothetical protein
VEEGSLAAGGCYQYLVIPEMNVAEETILATLMVLNQ